MRALTLLLLALMLVGCKPKQSSAENPETFTSPLGTDTVYGDANSSTGIVLRNTKPSEAVTSISTDVTTEVSTLLKSSTSLHGQPLLSSFIEQLRKRIIPQIAVNAPESFISLSPIIKQHPQYQELPKV